MEKPCYILGWCPYGQLVEDLPRNKDHESYCHVFGHHCPVWYFKENIKEEDYLSLRKSRRIRPEG